MNHPNILFVFADQLRYSALACNGNRTVRTPNLDRLAGEGVVFDRAFSSCPICSPYRGQLLTGNYPHVNGVICNQYRLFGDQRTLAHRLGERQYRTAFVGKWHLGHGPYPPPKRYGFDDLIAYNCGHSYYRMSYYRNERGPFRTVEYAPRAETRLALEWIDEHRRQQADRPFCLVLSWGPPHWSGWGGAYSQYPQEYRIYDPARVEVPENVPPQFRDFAAREIADYYGMVTSLDDCMGQLLAGLERMGLAEDTLVCFSADHGDHLSAHGYGKPSDEWMHHTLRASKGTPHAESIHIPLILRCPSLLPRGQRTDVLFSSVDVLPTLLALCGLGAPGGVQGTDLSFAALGGAGKEPDSVYLQILGPGWPNRTKWVGLWRGLRTPEFTYARWHDRGGMRVLYDLRTDPLEMHNVVDDPAYADVAARLEARLKKWIAATGDPFDTGARLGETEMLDLGQAVISRQDHELLPKEYAKAIEANHARFESGGKIVHH